MTDKVNQAKASTKQMPQQSQPQQDSQAPQQAPPYPPQGAGFQYESIYCVRGCGKVSKFRPGPKTNYQCGGYGHCGTQCQYRQYSQPSDSDSYGLTYQYEYNTYLTQLQEPPHIASPQEQYEGQWHPAPSAPQMPQHGCPGVTAGDSLCSADLFLEPLVKLTANGRDYMRIIDTGARYSTINTLLPPSRNTVHVGVFPGNTEERPLSKPVPCVWNS